MSSGQYAMLFPGQGSQSTGMLEEAFSDFVCLREAFAEASDYLNLDLWALTRPGSESQLNLTKNTQPILLAASVGLWREFLTQCTVLPSVLAGHSLGEFSALVCAGVIDFQDAIKLVQYRGEFMQEAVPVDVGAMAAIIGLDANKVDTICAELTLENQDDLCVSAVNYNSPDQIVIAGHRNLVDLAIAKLKIVGARKAIPLTVSAPFHTKLMRPAGEKLKEKIESTEFREPQIYVLSNVTAELQKDPLVIKELLVQQISSPVNWLGCMQFISAMGIKNIIECGPGSVLKNLCRRIDKDFTCLSIEKPNDLYSAVEINS